MKYLFAIVLFAVFVAAHASSTVKPTKRDNDGKNAPCNVNYYFYAGANTKKIEQQLTEMREEIREEKPNWRLRRKRFVTGFAERQNLSVHRQAFCLLHFG